jgi:ribosomal protein S18 acetylase RimI-like enzyme
MNPVRIRLATPADTELLLDMMGPFNEYERIPWTRDAARAPLRTLLACVALGIVGVAEAEAKPLGYFVVTWNYDLEWNGRDAFLTELYLVAEARDRGVGRTLLAEAERLAVEHGAHALHLMVRPENERAHALYVKAGYVSPKRVFLTKVFSLLPR